MAGLATVGLSSVLADKNGSGSDDGVSHGMSTYCSHLDTVECNLLLHPFRAL